MIRTSSRSLKKWKKQSNLDYCIDMKTYNFNVGPSQLFDSVPDHLVEAIAKGYGSISHRSKAFEKIYQHSDEQLKILLNIPKENNIFFTGSASEIFEKIGQNLIENSSHHFVNGSFSAKFYDYIHTLHLHPTKVEKKMGEGFLESEMTIPTTADLIAMTQNETSTGVMIDEVFINQIKIHNPDKILAVDMVSSAPICNIDYRYVDTTFFSVQKCFGMPAGLGVWIVNDKVIEKAKSLQAANKNTGAHHSILDFYKNYQNFQTPCTPNVLYIYVLGKIAEEMNTIGIEKIRAESKDKSEILETMIAASSILKHSVDWRFKRSETVRVLNIDGDNTKIIKYLNSKKLDVGAGYGQNKNTQIRIGIFPAVPIEAYTLLCEEIGHFEKLG
jgi:phosphoserine aminotransferase